MNMPALKFGGKQTEVPIIQGGMGIGVSMAALAGAVANAGGVGVISGAQIGYREEDFKSNTDGANIRGLVKEVELAKSISPDGIIGVNFLTAMNNYGEMVEVAVKSGVDLIISGAGLPLELPRYVKGSSTSIVPIVSSSKAAKVILKKWDRDYEYTADGIIIEGHLAGGHLGFKREELELSHPDYFKEMLEQILDIVKPFEEKYGRQIPIILAGGIYSGQDMKKAFELGASGVQMATRFVATDECDAHINFKKAYVKAQLEDIAIIKSPVGMPGRAIRNDFVNRIEQGNIKVKRCYRCLKECVANKTPYCITDALIDAVNGDIDNGLIFAGHNVYRVDKIVSVKTLIAEILEEAKL